MYAYCRTALGTDVNNDSCAMRARVESYRLEILNFVQYELRSLPHDSANLKIIQISYETAVCHAVLNFKNY